MKRAVVVSAVVVLALLLAVPGLAAATPPPANAECLGCHSTGGAAMSAPDFSAAGVDTARCNSCHWVERHEFDAFHTQANVPDYMSRDCSVCHAGNGFPRRASYLSIPAAWTTGGWFASAASLEASSGRLHAIHTSGSWPSAIGGADSSTCSSCHGHAACEACHTAPVAHAAHTLSSPRTVALTTLIGRKSGDAVTDTYLYSYRPTSAYGTGVSVYVGRTGSGEERAILRFPLSRLDPASSVTSASLHLTRASSGGAFEIRAYRLRRPVNAAVANWNVFATGLLWGVAGAKDASSDYVASPFAASAAGDGVFDVTTLLQAAIAAGEGSLDLVLVDPSPVANRYAGFYSSDTTMKDWMPQLEVTASSTASVWGNPPLTYRVASGSPFGMESYNLTHDTTSPCVNAACHALPAAATDAFTPACGSCHTPHGELPDIHATPAASSVFTIRGVGFGNHACSECHAPLLATHENRCASCHPSPWNTVRPWSRTCTEGGCHTSGAAVPHPDLDTSHAAGAASCTTAAGCHAGGGNLAAIHKDRGGCADCHAAGRTPSTDCRTCHDFDRPHGDMNAIHTAGVTTGRISTFSQQTGQHGPTGRTVPCANCHGYTNLLNLHGTGANNCRLCHFGGPRRFTAWNRSCQQAGCHPGSLHSATAADTAHGALVSAVPWYAGGYWNSTGWRMYGVCWNCHMGGDFYDAAECSTSCHNPPRHAATPPVTTPSSLPVWSRSAVTVTLTVDASNVRDTYFRLDQGPWRTGTAPLTTVTATTEGTHTLSFYSIDDADGRESTKTITFGIDWTPPVTSTDATATYHGSATIHLTATDGTGSGVVGTYIQWPGNPWFYPRSSYTAQWFGESWLNYYAVDAAGNVEPVRQVWWTLLQ